MQNVVPKNQKSQKLQMGYKCYLTINERSILQEMVRNRIKANSCILREMRGRDRNYTQKIRKYNQKRLAKIYSKLENLDQKVFVEAFLKIEEANCEDCIHIGDHTFEYDEGCDKYDRRAYVNEEGLCRDFKSR